MSAVPDYAYLVFLESGDFLQCTADDLQSFSQREDFLFAIDLDGTAKIVDGICDEFELCASAYGEVVAAAFISGTVSGANAARLAAHGKAFGGGETLQ